MTLGKLEEKYGLDIIIDQIENIEVVGSIDQSKEVMNDLFQMGFTVTRSGPYTDQTMFPRCDTTRFLFKAYRYLEKGE